MFRFICFQNCIILLVGIILGIVIRPVTNLSAEDRYQGLQTFAKVLNLVQQFYVEPVDSEKLIRGGIKGMLQALDPHTYFLEKEAFETLENETSGEFGGLGVEITVQDDVLTVISPIEDTPAWRAGIEPGDQIIAIDGQSTQGFTLVEAAQAMRGPRGSEIVLSVKRESLKEPKDITIRRERVRIRSVRSVPLEGSGVYIRLTSFIDNTKKDLERELQRLTKKGLLKDGVVLDLRKNPGGLLEQAVSVADLFIDSGDIVSTKGRDKNEKEKIAASGKGQYTDFPMIILIDAYSASASEIVAGALQDNQRAIIMGQPSFGKGSVQSVVKLGDGSGLKMTVARYYTPSGRSIQAEGINPDVFLDEIDPELYQKAVIQREHRRERDIERHLDHARKTRNPSSVLWSLQALAESNDDSETVKLLRDDYQLLQATNTLKLMSFGAK